MELDRTMRGGMIDLDRRVQSMDCTSETVRHMCTHVPGFSSPSALHVSPFLVSQGGVMGGHSVLCWYRRSVPRFETVGT